MTPTIAFLAAIGCALCNGISTVQQKVGADHEKMIHSFDLTFLLRLLKNKPYVFGIFLGLAGYCLVLVALRQLPLFLVQAISATSIVVTAYGERVFLHKKIPRQSYWALGAVVAGLALLSVGAVSSRATFGSQQARLLIGLLPIPLAIGGFLFIYVKRRLSAFVLAAFGGLAYGNTSTIGRIITYPHPYWKIAENPLLWSLVGSAVLGQYLFSVSLQRISATRSNAVMISLQTLGPALCGLFFFNDEIRSGFQGLVLLGIIMVIVGSTATAIEESPVATI
jgi:drug/metabolite transporter (DMT)-like permease